MVNKLSINIRNADVMKKNKLDTKKINIKK